MGCERFSAARVQTAFGETPDDPSWAEHSPDCYHCASEIGDMDDLRRLYEAAPRRTLNRRSKSRIVAALKRDARSRRLRGAAVAAIFLLGATLAMPGTRSQPAPLAAIPSATAIDKSVVDVRERIGNLEKDLESPKPCLDSALEDLSRQIRLLAWETDDENM